MQTLKNAIDPPVVFARRRSIAGDYRVDAESANCALAELVLLPEEAVQNLALKRHNVHNVTSKISRQGILNNAFTSDE